MLTMLVMFGACSVYYRKRSYHGAVRNPRVLDGVASRCSPLDRHDDALYVYLRIIEV